MVGRINHLGRPDPCHGPSFGNPWLRDYSDTLNFLAATSPFIELIVGERMVLAMKPPWTTTEKVLNVHAKVVQTRD